jgi:putative membrane protein
MKAFFSLCERYSRVFLYTVWFYALSGLLPERQYESFLRPEFGLLLMLGVVVVIAFLLAEMTRREQASKPGFAGAMRWLLLVAPLVYLPIARGVVLDAGAFDKRWTGLNGYAKAGDTPLIEQAAQAVANVNQSVTLVDLCWRAERYSGCRITVEGMIKHVPEISAEFGTNTCLLYRFVISCCAADAMPAAILLEGELPQNCPDDTWLKAEGTLKLEKRNDSDVVRLELDRATKLPRPENPYLY